MSKKRLPIPKNIQNEIMDQSRGYCYCGKRGDEIHHIDKKPDNNDIDNLVLLCHDHHDEASVTNGLRKRLSPAQIKRARNKLYKQNEEKAKLELKNYTHTLKRVTDENLYRASLDAVVTLDILKISNEYSWENNWEKRRKILLRLGMFVNHASIRTNREIIHALVRASEYPREGMTASVADAISFLTIEFFPYPENVKEKAITLDLAESCGQIAFDIIYDALIYLGNFAIACAGLDLLKYLQIRSKVLKMPKIEQIVAKNYAELERNLQRPERNDLENAKRLLSIYKENLNKSGLRVPDVLPDDLKALISKHRD